MSSYPVLGYISNSWQFWNFGEIFFQTKIFPNITYVSNSWWYLYFLEKNINQTNKKNSFKKSFIPKIGKDFQELYIKSEIFPKVGNLDFLNFQNPEISKF